MSRVANDPISLPKGVEVKLEPDLISVKGSKGSLSMALKPEVTISQEENLIKFAPGNKGKEAHALSGTYRALVANMVHGVAEGFEKKLQLVGVGYRAQAQGKKLNLTVGYSHPVEYELPEGVSAETPSPTEIILRAADRQVLGQVAAEIRAKRPPEPYKGKGIRYADEMIRRKEAKKK